MLFLRFLFALSLGSFLAAVYLYFESDLFSPPLHEFRQPVKAQGVNYEQCVSPVEIEPIMVATHRKQSLGHSSGAWIQTSLGDNYFVTNAHSVLSNEYDTQKIVTNDPREIKEVTGNAVVTLHHKGTDQFVRAEVMSIINNYGADQYLSSNGYAYFNFTTLADVAILKVDNLPSSFTRGLTQLPLATDDYLPVKLQSTGYKPKGFSIMERYDLCRFIMYDDNSIAFLDQKNVAIKGMSGSPWVNDKGEIFGLLMIAGRDKESDIAFTVSHIEDDLMYLGFSNLHPGTLKTYAFATPVKWIHRALEMIDNE